MCGIAGIAGRIETGVAASSVAGMVAAMARRGPDGEGMEVWEGAVLGHRRLAVFDLSSSGRQPMLSEDRSLGVVFNGAIYNFMLLRAQLEAEGSRFRSRTDTEVLIHGYRAWGIDGLVSRLHGMFAFGLWDAVRKRLFLVRDRLGVKPLLYALRDGVVWFASTARALRSGGAVFDLDEEAVAEYLEFGFVTDERTIFRGASKVPAGSVVEFRDGETRTWRYWSLPCVSDDLPPSFDEAVEETETLLLDAVKLRLQADVTVGALLSGGVDSSLVCWAIRRLGGNIRAYTVGVPGHPWDESRQAAATARELGIDHLVVAIPSDAPPEKCELVSAYGEPFACGSALGMLRVSRAVRNSATVLLTGDGGDDLFLGYPEHRHFWAAQRLARLLPDEARRAWPSVRALLPRNSLARRGIHFLDYACGGLGAVAAAHDGLPYYARQSLLGERMKDVGLRQRRIPWSSESARNLLSDFLVYDQTTRFTGEYLTKIDGATMYHGLEARSPFLDQNLWEFGARLPYDRRLRKFRLKSVLRELAERRLGPRVANAGKKGFLIPVQQWLAGRWRESAEKVFQDSLLEREGYIRPGSLLSELLNAVRSGTGSKQLWYLYVLESWMRGESP